MLIIVVNVRIYLIINILPLEKFLCNEADVCATWPKC